MPKMKTHKGAAKRFKITKKGKLKHFNAGHSHLQSSKSPKRRRKLRKASLLADEHAGRVARLLLVRRVRAPQTPSQATLRELAAKEAAQQAEREAFLADRRAKAEAIRSEKRVAASAAKAAARAAEAAAPKKPEAAPAPKKEAAAKPPAAPRKEQKPGQAPA
ncbi:MAG: 50S ribosomal protein L35 [Planctomycetes bacterium]|nr:50S ribosomal protein L35 [Planctomycetota bacterium]